MSVEVRKRGRALCVRVDGDEFALLERTAAAMNRPGWTDGDNTALTVFLDWVLSWTDDFFEAPGPLAASILDGIDTGRTGTEHRRRLAELETAFREAGLLREGGAE